MGVSAARSCKRSRYLPPNFSCVSSRLLLFIWASRSYWGSPCRFRHGPAPQDMICGAVMPPEPKFYKEILEYIAIYENQSPYNNKQPAKSFQSWPLLSTWPSFTSKLLEIASYRQSMPYCCVFTLYKLLTAYYLS